MAAFFVVRFFVARFFVARFFATFFFPAPRPAAKYFIPLLCPVVLSFLSAMSFWMGSWRSFGVRLSVLAISVTL